jgi:hypothetical protein
MATYERIDNGSPDGSMWGGAASDKLGYYGKVPVAQRAFSSAVHASSAASVSSSFGATQLAILQEIMNTLTALGVWASA